MITLNTIIYEGNFREVLNDDSWFIRSKFDLITRKQLTVNNLNSSDELQVLLAKYPYISVTYVNDNLDFVKNLYNLKIDENTIGYYYTIPYFTAIESVETEFILNVASDCMRDIKITDTFLLDSIKELNNDDKCSTTMVAWCKNNHIMANGVTIGRHENYETFRKLNRKYLESEMFNYSFGFTDQFFFGKISNLKKINYNIAEDVSEQIYNGPNYGGNSFEKRIVGHQVQNNVCNCIYKGTDYYIHDGKN